MKPVAIALAILLLVVLSVLALKNYTLSAAAEARIRGLEASHADQLAAVRAEISAVAGAIDAVAAALALEGADAQRSLALVHRRLSEVTAAQARLGELLSDARVDPPGVTPAPPAASLVAEQDLRLQSAMEQATEHYAAGRFREARKLSAAVLEQQPDDPRARLLHGLSLYHENPGDSAAHERIESTLLPFAQGSDADARALRALGHLALEQGRWVQARDRLTRAAALEPASPRDAMAIGFCSLRLGDLAEAREAFDEACRLSPDDVEAWHFAGIACAEAGDREAALERFARCVSLDPGFAAARLRAGELLADLGRCGEALQMLDPIRRLPEAATTIGDCHERLGDAQAARSAWLEASRPCERAPRRTGCASQVSTPAWPGRPGKAAPTPTAFSIAARACAGTTLLCCRPCWGRARWRWER